MEHRQTSTHLKEETVAQTTNALLAPGAQAPDSGANGTPTFFVNGYRYDGSWDDIDVFEAALLEAAGAARARGP